MNPVTKILLLDRKVRTKVAEFRARLAGGYPFPLHGWLGVGLVLIFWTLNWGLDGLRTHWGFFPLWLGYSLAVDGLNVSRRGTSLLTRDWRMYIGLFIISAPIWWSFELVNWRTQNWAYLGREFFTDLEYLALATLSFSTVIPAVLGTAELFAGMAFIRRLRPGPRLGKDLRTTRIFYALGLVMFLVMMAWPRYFLSVYLALHGLRPGADQRVAGQPVALRVDCPAGLEPHHCLVAWSARLRVLLGVLELFFLPKMGLFGAVFSISACFRNAFAGVWRLFTLCPRTAGHRPPGDGISRTEAHRIYYDRPVAGSELV